MENKNLYIIFAVIGVFILFVIVSLIFRSIRRRKEIMENYEKIHLGMTKEKVVKILGSRYKKRRAPGNVEKLEWHFKSVPQKGKFFKRQKLVLVAEFKREKVIRTNYFYK